MGISCKKPSRGNTARAAEFVAKVLVHIHSDMNVVLKDPSEIPKLNAEIAKVEGHLVSRYEYDQAHKNVKVYVSSYKLRKLFGKPAETIWRKLFIRINKGGWSSTKQQAYDSCWVLNQEAERRFMFAKQPYMNADGVSPAQLLQVLEGLDEKVVAPTEYAAEVDPKRGVKVVFGVTKKVMARDRHRAVLRDSQELRAGVREDNRLLRCARRAQAAGFTVSPASDPA